MKSKLLSVLAKIKTFCVKEKQKKKPAKLFN